MGYQESFIRVKNLGEAAGYKDSINSHGDESFYFYCAARAKKNMNVSRLWGGHPDDPSELPFIEKDELFAVVGGSRRPYQTYAGMIFTDSIAGLDDVEGAYRDFFEDFEDAILEERAQGFEESRRKAREAMNGHLDHCWD